MAPQTNITPMTGSVKFSGVLLEFDESARTLGVNFSGSMNWGAHLHDISAKARFIIVALSRLRQEGLPRSFLLNVYRSLFEPAVLYCLVVWGSTYANVLNKVQILQNDALKAILGAPRRSSVRKFMRDNLLLNVRQSYRFQAGCFVYRSLYNLMDQTEALFWKIDPPKRNGLRNADMLTVHECLSSTNYVTRGPQASAAKVWNSIPLEIRQCPTLDIFKFKLRTYIVSSV